MGSLLCCGWRLTVKTLSNLSGTRNVVRILPAVAPPEGPAPPAAPLEVVVLFLKMQGTLEAIETAADLARGLQATLRLIVLREVPYALPLSEPAVSNDFAERQLCDFVSNLSCEVAVDVYLCRSRTQELRQILKPHSLVLLCARKGWWPSPEKKLAKFIKKNGHQVLLIPAEQ